MGPARSYPVRSVRRSRQPGMEVGDKAIVAQFSFDDPLESSRLLGRQNGFAHIEDQGQAWPDDALEFIPRHGLPPSLRIRE
jgi:hypothetical protein